MSEKKIRINLTLDGGLVKKFREVKEDLGLKENTNVLRYLIANEYERVVKSGRVLIPFSEREQRQIEKWAEKLGTTPQQIMDEAVRLYLKELGVKLES